MPYIVTTTMPDERTGPSGESYERVSRRAVATSEDVRDHLTGLLLRDDYVSPPAFKAARVQIKALTESGGTVGPLPDGTVIEVEAHDWRWLAERSDMSESEVSNLTYEVDRDIIACAAFNATQGVEA